MSVHPLTDDPRLKRVLDALPHSARRAFVWLIRPQAKWLRRPLAIALMAGGIFGFLPVLGFWMLPIGGLLLGEDIPPVRRATLGGLGRMQRWWDRWNDRMRSRRSRD